MGTIPEEALTRDGVAVTTYRPSLDTGVATVIAQVQGVRDTMFVTLY
jgi:hypothetical protein